MHIVEVAVKVNLALVDERAQHSQILLNVLRRSVIRQPKCILDTRFV